MEAVVRIKRELAYQGTVLKIYRDTVIANGIEEVFDYIHHNGAAAVLPVTADGKIMLVRQYRNALDRFTLELPAGKVDSPEEPRIECAYRELEEETGYTAEEWISLGDYYPSPAYCDERITLYLARGLQLGKRHLDEDEFLNFEFIPLSQLVEDVMNGQITDGKTQVAVLKAARILQQI